MQSGHNKDKELKHRFHRHGLRRYMGSQIERGDGQMDQEKNR